MKPSRTAYLMIALMLGCYLLAFGLRAQEFAVWQADPAVWLGGEPLMTTADGYVWLAGAEGLNRYSPRGMSRFIRGLAFLTDGNVSRVGLWLPAVVAPLVVIPAALIGFFLGGWSLALPGALLAGCSLTYLMRTRLGMPDTDNFSLLGILLICLAFIWCYKDCCREWWSEGNVYDLRQLVRRSLVVGSVCIIALLPYPNMRPVVLTVLLAGYGTLFLNRPRCWLEIFLAFMATLNCLYGGLPGLALALAVILVLKYEDGRRAKGLAVILLCCSMMLYGSVWSGFVNKFAMYLKVDTGSDLILPNTLQSISEIQNVSLHRMLTGVTGNVAVFVLGLVGSLLLVFKRPLALVLLPLLGVTLASFKVGNRFLMFGGLPVGLGFGYLVYRLNGYLSARKRLQKVLTGLCSFIMILPIVLLSSGLKPIPVLPPVHALTFSELETMIPEDAVLWDMWHFGYAAHYCARRDNLGDGGNFKATYPLSLVRATDSETQAARMMMEVARFRQQYLRDKGRRADLHERNVDESSAVPFMDMFAKYRDGERANAYVEGLRRPCVYPHMDVDPQYLVVSWDEIRSSHWVSYMGTWDFKTGKGTHSTPDLMGGDFDIHLDTGFLDGLGPVDSLKIVGEKENRDFEWNNNSGQHLVYNADLKLGYFLNDDLHSSMLMRMLLDDPREFDDYFELVVDHFPWCRGYRLRQENMQEEPLS